MTVQLYLDDSYLREFEAVVVKAEGRRIILDRTAFYPDSGGQPADTGILARNNDEFRVTAVKKQGAEIIHEIDKDGLKAGDKVVGKIDWEKRHALMRYHTTAHILSTIVHDETGCKIGGNQLGVDGARIDFDLEKFDREKLASFAQKANEIIRKNLAVKTYTMPREEAFKIPSVCRLLKELPETIQNIRIVEIEGFDRQACAGTHVKNTSEIGRIEITGAENKGKTHRRIYFTLKKWEE